MSPVASFKFRIKAVIFDMDGVITNTMPDHFRVWKEIFGHEGIHVTHHDIYSREGQRGLTSVLEIFAQYGRRVSVRRARRLLQKKEKLFKRIVRQRFVPGARTFLRDLDKQGFCLALVTGTSRHELHRILPASVYKHFDVTVTGSDVKNGKPHPEPYRKALNSLKLPAKDAIAIENAPFGIRSACAAGLKCLALETSLPALHLKGAAAIFSSIKELRTRSRFIAG